MEATETSFNEMQTVKRHFFAMRNGVIADVLRKAGSPFRIIFGLNLPQVAEIAESTPHTLELAERLWANSTTRESMMIAPMLVDPGVFSESDALRWLETASAYEIIDIMCLKLLRKCDFAVSLAEKLRISEISMLRYAGLRIMFNLVNLHTDHALAYADAVLASENEVHLINLARSLYDECVWLSENRTL